MDINEISSSSFSIPYELIFMEKKIYDETYQELLIDKRSIFNEFLSFIHEQFSYMIYSNKTSNKDFDFFKKWQKIIDYQIEDNSFDIYELQYSKYKIENNLVVFYVSDLKEYNKKFQEKKSKEIIIVLNNTNLGFLDDYSIEDNKLITKIDLLKDSVNISENGKILIKIKNYQAVLQKQKKALKDFSFSKIVNQDLKQLLISPNLISYKALVDNYELDFKNKNLTNNQKEIIKRAFNEKNIFLIQGPPGTGKTTIIKELIYQTIKQDNYSKILIVSQQNVAVDNVLYGIDKENREWFEKDGHSIVRVAPNENKIQYDNIKEYTVEKWFEKYKEEIRDNFIKLEQNKNDNEKFKNMYDYANKWMKLIYKLEFKDIDNEIKELLISKHQILGATCVGLANKSLGLDLIEFDIAIIDEAGRATAPELLIPILRAKKVILIGDHNQLPPTVDKKLLEKLEEDTEKNLSFEDLEILEKSFFEELYEKIPESNKMMLNEQFRMPEQIGNLISTLFYNNSIKNGHIKDTTNFIDSKAIIRWLNVDGVHKLEGTSSYNDLEVKKIIDLILIIEKFLQKNNTNKSVGIITPYSSQKRRIKKSLKDLDLFNVSNLKVDTVDSFQGEESDIIIYSTVKTNGNISFLIDKKRLNVAISRTKENLFFIGKKDFFYNARMKKDEVNLFEKIINFCNNLE
jgi:superfamily I DNA and/or RNA helicase